MHPRKSFFSPSRKPFLGSPSELMRSPGLGLLILFMHSKSTVHPVDEKQDRGRAVNASAWESTATKA